MNRKVIFFITGVGILLLLAFYLLYPGQENPAIYEGNNVGYSFRLKDNYFEVYKGTAWQKLFVKGVNLGAAKPGAFPVEYAITKDEYLRWFKYIGEMNANTIRIYTLLNPEFYDALYEYNRKAPNPIYVFQGVWVNEEDIKTLKDAYHPTIIENFKKDIQITVDALHGNAVLKGERGSPRGKFKKDVSQYIMGWILGIEWDPLFVESTNKKNKTKNTYTGKYVRIPGESKGSPFECWLAECCDTAIAYETMKYNVQRPVSFVNWPTTDVLKHPNEPDKTEDLVSIDFEKIRTDPGFMPGLFASYHIYPYYPDFMSYQKEYAAFKDEKGKINAYKAYLRDLKQKHSMPVLVAEFGVPSSRGIAHESIRLGYNQGHMSEEDQGVANAAMFEDIYDEAYAGGIVFAWQDEWFKRTWNTMDFDIPDRRPLWSNTQTNEQEFGLLAFDPGKNQCICYVDGDISDWEHIEPLSRSDNAALYAQSDGRYLYIMAHIENYQPENKIIIPIDTLPDQGNTKIVALNMSLQKPSEYIIVIENNKSARLMVDPYYDAFYYRFKDFMLLKESPNFNQKDSGVFNPVYMAVSGELNLPQEKKTIPPVKFETGKLKFGNANPIHPQYDSLTDIAQKEGVFEIRIPWLLLNVMDPSALKCMDDIHKAGIKPIPVLGFYMGLSILEDDVMKESLSMNLYTWKKWQSPEYHERLKVSYYIMKEAFGKYQ